MHSFLLVLCLGISQGFHFGTINANIVPHHLLSCILLGIFNSKQSNSLKNNVFAIKNKFFGERSSPLFTSTLDEVEVERLASSTRKRKVVEDFVKKMGGKRTIQKVLIANNG